MKDQKIFEERFLDIGYESPISIIQNKIRLDIDNGVYKAVQDVGFSVDQKELQKALNYDRNQYMQGFKNGYKTGSQEAIESFYLSFIDELMRGCGDDKEFWVVKLINEKAKRFGVEVDE